MVTNKIKIIKVHSQDSLRKVEVSASSDTFNPLLTEAFSIYEPSCDVFGISTNNKGLYGLYVREKPSNSPVDLADVELDEKCNNLLSFKISSKSISAKVYSLGNKHNVDVGYPVVGTGEYIEGDSFTVYYVKDDSLILEGDSILKITEDGANKVDFGYCYANGFCATTFYIDGTVSAESIYTQEEEEDVPS